MCAAVYAVGLALVPSQHWAVQLVLSGLAMVSDLLVNQGLLTRVPRSNRLAQPCRHALLPPCEGGLLLLRLCDTRSESARSLPSVCSKLASLCTVALQCAASCPLIHAAVCQVLPQQLECHCPDFSWSMIITIISGSRCKVVHKLRDSVLSKGLLGCAGWLWCAQPPACSAML